VSAPLHEVGAELEGIRRLGTPRRYRATEVIFRQGEDSDYTVVVDRGVVKVSTLSPDGYETVLAIRSVGEIVGELAALDGKPRSATVTALTDVDVIVVLGEHFRSYLCGHSRVAIAMLRRVVDRLRDADRHRAEHGAYSVMARVAGLLLDLARMHRDSSGVSDGAVVAPLSQVELAGAVGASLAAVAKVLRRLRSEGLIATDRRRVTILRPEALKKLATGTG
jgi:CRP-like cAMP-binding protein